MEDEVKMKVSWTLGAIGMGWVFYLFIPTEDGQPITARDWWIWIAINVIALVRVHLWLSAPARAERRAMYNRRHHGRR